MPNFAHYHCIFELYLKKFRLSQYQNQDLLFYLLIYLLNIYFFYFNILINLLFINIYYLLNKTQKNAEKEQQKENFRNNV